LLDNLTLFHHVNLMRRPHRAQSMGDDEHCPPSGDLRHILLDDGLGFIVQRARGFIKDQNARVRDQRSRNRNPLALPTGQRAAVLSYDRVVAFRQFQNEFVRPSLLGGLHHLLHRHSRIGQRDVVAHGAIEEKVFLEHHPHLHAEPGRIHLREIHTVHQNTPARRHKEPLNQLGNGTLAGPGPPDQPNHLAGQHRERHLAQHLGAIRTIAKRHVVKHYLPCHLGQCRTIRTVRRLRLRIQDIPQPRHRDADLLQLLPQIDETQHRSRHLRREHREGNQLPDGHIPSDHAIGPQP
jgi:hypothetical protein